jgi:hypothetical protein
MKRTAVFTLRPLLTLALCFLPPAVVGQEQSSVPPEVTSVASRYLQGVDKSFSFPAASGREDFVLVGHSRSRSGEWRVIVVAGSTQPRVAWDSLSLNDPYLDVMGLSFINAGADGLNGYTVSLRGCAPHQCADGRIGFAVYASQHRRAYRSHILTKKDGSYAVTFYPRSGIPESYRDQLSRMMCSDGGISRPSALSLKCVGSDGGAQE